MRNNTAQPGTILKLIEAQGVRISLRTNQRRLLLLGCAEATRCSRNHKDQRLPST